MKKLQRITAVLVAVLLFLTVFSNSTYAADTQATSDAEYLQQVINLIKQKYNGNINDEDLMNAALQGMFGTLDKYSAFYNPDEFDSVFGSLQGEIEGIGVMIDLDGDYVVVTKVIPGSPAQKGGVLSGDKIAEVDGESVKGLQVDEVSAKVKGTEGTKVKIGVIRQGVKNIITLQMTRAQVAVPSVSYEIRGQIGYLAIDSFVANTSNEVAAAIKYFDSKKITKVVLDLRNNPGGIVDESVNVAKFFVPKGLITTLDYKDESVEDVKYYSNLEKLKYKLAVLVNENTASAAEILTGAIKDTKAGTIIGTKTYGKAKVQSFTPILTPDAYARLNKNSDSKTVDAMEVYSYTSDVLGWAKMTVGMYYTPNGECIDLKGIEPNINVSTGNDKIQANLIDKLSVTVKPKLGTKYYDVYNAECILKLLKYNVDEPDFTMDKKTFEAIKKFQKDNKLYGYGVLDFSTQKILNAKLDSLKQTQDAVYVKAAQSLK